MYQFESLYSTDSAFSYNITTDNNNQYMGRLYILAAEDPMLQNLGIEKEWFLAHESGEFLICGHINNSGEWSLSSYKSLEPSLQYTTYSKIFDQVFSYEYIQEVLNGKKVIESSQLVDNTKTFSDSNDNSDDTKETANSSIPAQLSISVSNLEILTDILLRSAPLELLQEVDMYQLNQPIEQEAPVMTENEGTSTQQPILPLEKTELLKIEQAIIDKVIEEYQTKETSEFILPTFGRVTIHIEDDYFVLSSSDDGHTILAATFDGEVMDELKPTDAIEFTSLLQSHEIEVSILNRRFLQQETEKVNQQKGIDYGT